MFLIDSHCHLNFNTFAADINAVIDRSLAAGVDRIIVPGMDLQTSREAIELAHRFDCVYAAVGVHPNECTHYEQSDIEQYRQFLTDDKVVAVGEIGLDYYHNLANKDSQIRTLSVMFEMASSVNKPIILHSRNSLPDLLIFIENHPLSRSIGLTKGIIHSFEGDVDEALKAIKMDFLIGAGGPVTFKNAALKQEIFSKIPLESIVLETDAPFLSPHPFRGERNEPARVLTIAEKIAELQGVALSKVAEITTRNVQLLFNWND